jgi:hexosaminidase
MENVSQLFYTHSTGAGLYCLTAPVEIVDAPKFAHRGLNMDVARNWYPKSNILAAIDALAWNKFNRLHIHMTDSQSWPLDIPSMPELSQKGAYQTGLSYTKQDLTDIQEYGMARAVEVYLEFDMPGHTSAIGYSHPELIAAMDAQPWGTYCNEPPCGSLKLDEPKVGEFLEKLFADLIPRGISHSLAPKWAVLTQLSISLLFLRSSGR